MWILDTLYNACIYLGLFKKRAKILLLGLDNAGKSTLMLRLIRDHLGALQPTIHPTSHELIIGNLRCTTFDLGGHQQARRLWRDYFPEVTGVVFMVDAKDPERFDEAREELLALLAVEELRDVPFMILGNKIDHPYAVSEDALRYQLGIEQVMYRPIELFMCSVVLRQGYGNGFRWLAQHV
ncbi:ADP-ribosylation factor family-domain-containing protein [Annulohypoxylon bovei var. microspora]|nr:ADP-ribosylation factor family-domain-containing protein [Annulohypoxylon bovei var. microspora]